MKNVSLLALSVLVLAACSNENTVNSGISSVSKNSAECRGETLPDEATRLRDRIDFNVDESLNAILQIGSNTAVTFRCERFEETGGRLGALKPLWSCLDVSGLGYDEIEIYRQGFSGLLVGGIRRNQEFVGPIICNNF